MQHSPTDSFAPIAIIGMGCRLPQAPNVPAYWRMLMGAVDGVTEVPASRWDVDAFYDPRPAIAGKTNSRWGGFVEDVDRFDPYFFGISPREAVRLDPQQRLLLESAWEAMEQAGIPRQQFRNSHTGVFMGVCSDDYITLERSDIRNADIYLGTGGSRDSIAGRIAFVYGLSGPVAAVDSACSSSLVAIHQACNSLLLGDCDMALAGGVNVILHPGTAIAFSQANLLSADGRCKAFDSRANGFVRSEGAGVVLLKPLANAIRDGDPVYAIIRGTASNNDGCSSPFMTPSRHGQSSLLRQAYSRAQIDPASVQYVEAHGTGTEVGDPIELGALADVLSGARSAGEPCLIGSSKTNLGHLEAAAGVAGLIKTVLCLNHKTIPPNLHFVTPNPNIPWADIPFRIPVHATPWPIHSGAARAGVNSFGISGTNAHVILEEAPLEARVATRSAQKHDAQPRDNEPQREQSEVLLISGHTPEVLNAVAASYRDAILNSELSESLRDVCYSAAIRRTHHEYRAGIACSSHAELLQRLNTLISGDEGAGIVRGVSSDQLDRNPVFVFSGIGTQWAEMGRQLRIAEPVFRDVLLQCDALIAKQAGWSVIEELDRDAKHSQLGRIDIMQPAIFSVQVALAALWRSFGVQPSAIIGHSLGEIAAAHVAGALSLEHAVLVVCMRSRLMHRTSGRGKMAAVGMTPLELARRIEPLQREIVIAVVNGPSSCTISGDADAVERLARALETEGVFCRILSVDVACHSHHMDALLPEFELALQCVSPSVATVPLYSTVFGRGVTGAELNARYWSMNLRDAVQFDQTVQVAMADGARAFLELSPQPVLLTPIRQIAKPRNTDVVVAGSLRTRAPERESLLESIATLFAGGVPIDLSCMYSSSAFVPPPTYSWQRERFWFEESASVTAWMTGVSAQGNARSSSHPLLGMHWEPADDPGTHCFETTLNLQTLPWLNDHRVEGVPLFPAAGYVELALAASMELFGAGTRVVRNLELRKALFMTTASPVAIQLVISDHNRHARRVTTTATADATRSMLFHCYVRSHGLQQNAEHGHDEWTLAALGHIDIPSASHPLVPPPDRDIAAEIVATQFDTHKSGQEFYDDNIVGFDFGPTFRSVREVWTRDEHAIALAQLGSSMAVDTRQYRVHPAFLDSLFHSLTALAVDSDQLSLPFAVERFELFELPNPSQPVWCEVESEESEAGSRASLRMYSESGKCLITVTGYETKFLKSEASERDASNWLFETRWRSVPAGQSTIVPGARWLLVGDAEGVANSATELELHGQRCVVVSSCASEEELRKEVLRFSGSGPCAGIVFCASGKALPAATSCDTVPQRAVEQCGTLLTLLQVAAGATWISAPRIFVVTVNAKDLGSLQDDLEVSQSSLAGLSRAAAMELREFRVTQVDIEETTNSKALVTELLRADNEIEIALRDANRFALRLVRHAVADIATLRTAHIDDISPESYRLESDGSGVFDGLKLHAVPRQVPAAGEVEIRVVAVGLNFLDVLKSLNMAPGLPEGARFFGMECSGRVVAVGADVHGFSVGDEVVVLDTTATGCFRAFITVSATAVLPKPAHLSLVEAATVPVAYQTAWYALSELGRLRKGESILIHSAAGGVGLAAMEIAKQRGAVIFATAGTEEKRDLLKRMGVPYIMNSRTLDFARDVMTFTQGRGVDMVLNSLAGEAIPASLGVLATGGRFIEIGKRDIYADSQLGLLPFQRNLSFFAVDLLRMRLEKPDVVDELTRDIAARMIDGTFKALPYTVFPVSKTADAFRYMAKGTHTGKIVVTLDEAEVEVVDVPPPISIRDDSTYLITGGLGALGLEFAETLVRHGARHLALMGRSAPGAAAEKAIDALRELGASVLVIAADVSDPAQIAQAFATIRATGVPLRGVLHSAGITDDKTLQQLSLKQLSSVFSAKVFGSWNLHTQLQAESLDFLVLFSSIASVIGAAGQANYAAANAFLDALAHYRRRMGLPALAVNWGPWADVGMAALDDNRGARMAERGLNSIPVHEGTELLPQLLQQRAPQIVVMPVNWPRWAESFPEAVRVPFLAEFASELQGQRTEQTGTGIQQQLLAADSRESALLLLLSYLLGDVARILRLPEERLNPKVSLIRFGLDSLMAVELKNRIESSFTVNVPAAKLLQGPSVAELSEWLIDEVLGSRAGNTFERDSAASMPASPVSASSATTVDVNALSDDEVSAMLGQLLAQPERD